MMSSVFLTMVSGTQAEIPATFKFFTFKKRHNSIIYGLRMRESLFPTEAEWYSLSLNNGICSRMDCDSLFSIVYLNIPPHT